MDNKPTDKGEWVSVETQLPKDGIIVDTKIDDSKGVRNEQKLKRRGSLWFTSDGKMYVYYTPTHWKAIPDDDGLYELRKRSGVYLPK